MLVYHPSVIFSYGIFQARMVGNVIPGTDLNSDMSIKRTLFPPIETFHACFFSTTGEGSLTPSDGLMEKFSTGVPRRRQFPSCNAMGASRRSV